MGGNDNMDSSSNNGGSQDTSLTENKHTIEEKESNSNTGLVVGLAVGVSLVVVAVIVVVMIFYRRKNRFAYAQLDENYSEQRTRVVKRLFGLRVSSKMWFTIT